eukprot:scaffold1330_cov240-Pinguiococcus_pyrenoidosus.AAC.25
MYSFGAQEQSSAVSSGPLAMPRSSSMPRSSTFTLGPNSQTQSARQNTPSLPCVVEKSGQLAQASLSLPSEKVSSAQMSQPSDSDSVWNVPAGHCCGSLFATPEQKKPGGHGSQPSWLLSFWNLPGGQEPHTVSLVAVQLSLTNDPGVQVSQMEQADCAPSANVPFEQASLSPPMQEKPASHGASAVRVLSVSTESGRTLASAHERIRGRCRAESPGAAVEAAGAIRFVEVLPLVAVLASSIAGAVAGRQHVPAALARVAERAGRLAHRVRERTVRALADQPARAEGALGADEALVAIRRVAVVALRARLADSVGGRRAIVDDPLPHDARCALVATCLAHVGRVGISHGAPRGHSSAAGEAGITQDLTSRGRQRRRNGGRRRWEQSRHRTGSARDDIRGLRTRSVGQLLISTLGSKVGDIDLDGKAEGASLASGLGSMLGTSVAACKNRRRPPRRWCVRRLGTRGARRRSGRFTGRLPRRLCRGAIAAGDRRTRRYCCGGLL